MYIEYNVEFHCDEIFLVLLTYLRCLLEYVNRIIYVKENIPKTKQMPSQLVSSYYRTSDKSLPSISLNYDKIVTSPILSLVCSLTIYSLQRLF